MKQMSRGPLSGAALGVTMAAANALSYVFVLILSRAFGPADFGGFSALSAYGIVLSVPAGAFQVIVARHVARKDSHTSGIRLALLIGVGLAGATIVASPLLTESFRLASTGSAMWLGLTLVPMTVTGAFQGVLLGEQRLVALSGLYVSTAVGRLTAGALGAIFGLSVTEVFALLCVAAAVVAVQGAWVCRRSLADDAVGSLLPELIRATSSLGAFIALTNVDVTLARVFLSDTDSGGYALAATFGRAVGWGTQFIALLLVPRMQGPGRRASLAWAHLFILVLGGMSVGVIAVAPRWWIWVAGGEEYTQFAALAVACVALGVLWALVQLWLFAEMGLGGSGLGRFAWLVVAAEALLVWLWFHDTPMQIVAVSAVGAGSIVLMGLFRARTLDRT